MESETRKLWMRRAGIALFALSGVLLLVMTVANFSGPHKTPVQAIVPEEKTYPDTYTDVTLSAHAAVVYDLTTGEVLYSKNEVAQLPLASLTKLLTVYAAADTMLPSAEVSISKDALAAEGDNGLTEGERFTFDELARFALVVSSNDAAQAIAEASMARRSVSPNALLASAAEAAGLSETYALNGTGLDVNTNTAGAYGSAKDVALLAGKLLEKAPRIAHATIEPSISIIDASGKKLVAKNTNPDVSQIPGLLLSKTGYTDLAGGNLVIVFDAGINHPIAIAVLGSTRDARFTDVEALLKATLERFI
ncbi:MAG: D-alanyl-D-alanine carboxypeptidase (penicillin-binding protein 5/6) [Parcubacteria bacterium C7867-001]|nr:MAG: D-alanyl-D-alanine carboxypeptidase (penicillin-binding protein 5/6) [Parcubacteria bacterium C7867-001]